MEHDPWLVNEVRRLTSDLHGLQTSLDLVPRKFTLGYSDGDAIVVVGQGEWSTLLERTGDARSEIVAQLNDFIENEFERQLHWSALRMLTAAGVLTTELTTFHGKLGFIRSRQSQHPGDLVSLMDWFEGQLLPVSQRLSTRLLQFISRVLDPASWTVTGALAGGTGPLELSMTFHPQTELRWRKQLQKEKRLQRVRVD